MRGFIAGLLAWLCVAGSALAEKRLALVIGNDSYQHIDALQKARADAKRYAALLREKDSSVEERYDLGFVDMQGAVAEFVEKIEAGDTAVFVYSGHGWSDGAHNYLVGVDAPERASQERLTRLSLPMRNGANGVLDDFERKGAALKVAIIDACRDAHLRGTFCGCMVSRVLAGRGPPRVGESGQYDQAMGHGERPSAAHLRRAFR
jgi:uncharacterized caspase-like protein